MVDTEILCFLEKVRLAPRFADTEILCFLEKVRSTPRFADTEILYFLKKVRSRQIPPYSNSADHTELPRIARRRRKFGANTGILTHLGQILGYWGN